MQKGYLLIYRLFLLIFLLVPTLSFGMGTDKVEKDDENGELVPTTNKSIKTFDEMKDFLGVLPWDIAEVTIPFLKKESFVALSLLNKNYYEKFKSNGMQELKNGK